MTRSRLTIAAVVVLVAAIGGVAWYLLRPAPSEVDLSAALQQIGGADTLPSEATSDPTVADPVDETTDTTTDGAADAPAEDDGVEGTWTVSTDTADFDVADTTGTFVGFRIVEELADVGVTDAVGRTPEVTGTLIVDGTTITDAAFDADLTSIVSDRSLRDSRIQDALDTATHPIATFTLTELIEMDAVPADGETVTVEAVGELTVHGQTDTVTVPLEAAVSDGVLVVTGSFEVELATYGVTVPSAPIVVSAEDVATVELQLFLTR